MTAGEMRRSGFGPNLEYRAHRPCAYAAQKGVARCPQRSARSSRCSPPGGSRRPASPPVDPAHERRSPQAAG
eukprot:5352537-Prymnesium_polylepis.1